MFVSSPSTSPDRSGIIRIGNTDMLPLSAVRDLGVYVDADFTTSVHVTTTVRAFRSTVADTKRAAFIDAGCLADTDPVTDHYEA